MTKPIERVREVRVFENSYGTLFNDHVRSSKGVDGRYLRWQWSQIGVVVVPRRGDRVALSPAYRYPVGRELLEFPRGGGALEESVEAAAARELAEETGLEALTCRVIGAIYPESGLLERAVSVVEAIVSESRSAPVAEEMESIADHLVWMDVQEAWQAIRTGQIQCAITIAALALTPEFLE